MLKKTFITIVLFVSVTILFSLAFVVYNYLTWRNEYIEQNDSVICSEDIEGKDYSIEEKVKAFVLSFEKSDFVSFTPEEILQLMNENIVLSGNLKLQGICLEPNDSHWKVYFNTKLGFINIPWVGLNVVKEKRETPELYVDEILLGGLKIPQLFVEKIISDINMGISDGVVLMNENSFLGRTIINIELMKENVVVKGTI